MKRKSSFAETFYLVHYIEDGGYEEVNENKFDTITDARKLVKVLEKSGTVAQITEVDQTGNSITLRAVE